MVKEQGVQLGMKFLDGTGIRAQQKTVGAAKKPTFQRNGTIVKHLAGFVAATGPRPVHENSFAICCMITDAIGRAVDLVLAPGPVHELPHVVAQLDQLPGVLSWVVSERGCSSHGSREHVWDLGAQPAVLPKQDEVPMVYPDRIYAHRHQAEQLWANF